jgi:hypothetical protein
VTFGSSLDVFNIKEYFLAPFRNYGFDWQKFDDIRSGQGIIQFYDKIMIFQL